MSAENSESAQERFDPPGRVLGVLAVIVGLAVAIGGLFEPAPRPWWQIAGGALFAALAWAAMLRPRVAVDGSALELRNMVDTVRIPLAAVEEVAVRQVLVVRAGERRFTSSALGRSRRQIRRDGDASMPEASYGMLVESRLRNLAESARSRAGVKLYSQEQVELAGSVERRLAVPEIVALAVCTVGFVLAIVL